MTPDRRTFLTSAGLAALAVSTSAVTSGCTPSGGASGGGAPAPGTSATLSVPVDSIPVGGGKILDNAAFLVTQPTAGEFKAFNKTCTHQGCPVSSIEGPNIVCRCHGANFSIVDGSVTKGPATKPLRPATAVLEGAEVKISAS